MTAIGSSIVRTSQEFSYDPQYGDTVTEVWQGTRNACVSLESSFRSVGLRTRLSHDGPVWTLEVSMPPTRNPGEPEDEPTSTWDFVTERIQVDILQSPKIWLHMKNAFGEQDALGWLSLFVRWINSAIDEGLPLAAVLDAAGVKPNDLGIREDSVLKDMYSLRSQGDRTYEYHRPALVRTRAYSQQYARRHTIDIIPKFYTTAALVSTFQIPAGIASLLPSGGIATPLSKAWGWKVRVNDQRFISALNKVEEKTDWIFDLWSLPMYDRVRLPGEPLLPGEEP
jgi:hypothetical protein